MLATTLGIEFNPDTAWDEREQLFKMSERIVRTSNVTQSAIGNKDGTFKGAKDKASESCIEMFQKCCTGVKDPEALCAFIAKKSGYGFADT